MDVKKVAKLANLPLTLDEEKKYQSQLDKVLEYVDQLQKTDTKNVSETAQSIDLKNVSRADKIGNCPPLVKGYIKIPAIFGHD